VTWHERAVFGLHERQQRDSNHDPLRQGRPLPLRFHAIKSGFGESTADEAAILVFQNPTPGEHPGPHLLSVGQRDRRVLPGLGRWS
jgi:hypothetical protein